MMWPSDRDRASPSGEPGILSRMKTLTRLEDRTE